MLLRLQVQVDVEVGVLRITLDLVLPYLDYFRVESFRFIYLALALEELTHVEVAGAEVVLFGSVLATLLVDAESEFLFRFV